MKMSTLKDAQYAVNGEPKIAAIQQEEYRPKSVMKEDKTKETSDFVLFKLIKNNRTGGVHIPCVDFVIDPRTITDEKPHGNGPEMIRLLKGVTTIWAKEQKDLDKEYIKKEVRHISFNRGSRFMKVPSWDVSLLEFMRVCIHNVTSESRTSGSKLEFFEYDPNEVAKERLATEMLEIDMVIKAKEQTYDTMQKHAFYLGIPLVNELGMTKKEDALRAEYMISAKRDPKTFKKSLGSKEVEISYMVRTAIIDSKIDVSKGDGRAYWSNGGGLICTLPRNEKPVDVLTNLALQKNKDGTDFLAQLKAIVT